MRNRPRPQSVWAVKLGSPGSYYVGVYTKKPRVYRSGYKPFPAYVICRDWCIFTTTLDLWKVHFADQVILHTGKPAKITLSAVRDL